MHIVEQIKAEQDYNWEEPFKRCIFLAQIYLILLAWKISVFLVRNFLFFCILLLY